MTALAVFYFSTTYGWRVGCALGICAGAAIDALYGRSFFATPAEMVLVSAMSYLWLHKGDPTSSLPNLIPGALSAVAVSLPQIAWDAWSAGNTFHLFLLLLSGALFGAFALPLMIKILDYFADRVSLPKYKTAQAEARSGKR